MVEDGDEIMLLATEELRTGVRSIGKVGGGRSIARPNPKLANLQPGKGCSGSNVRFKTNIFISNKGSPQNRQIIFPLASLLDPAVIVGDDF